MVWDSEWKQEMSRRYWEDFTADLRLHAITHMPQKLAHRVRTILKLRGVNIFSRINVSVKHMSVECWTKISFPLTTEENKNVDTDTPGDINFTTGNRVNIKSTGPSYDSVIVNPPLTHRKTDRSALLILMKAFGSCEKYSWAWDQDLLEMIQVYELAAEFCSLDPDTKPRGIPIMPEGCALFYYGSYVKNKDDFYDSAISMLLTWFN